MRLLQRAAALVIPRGWWRDLRDPNGPGVRFALCHTCKLRHPLGNIDLDARWDDFANNHRGHLLEMIKVRNPDQYGEMLWYAPNADVKMAFQGAQSLVVTNLHSLASSPTAGWQSAAVVNTSALYLDDLYQFVFAPVNTAPGGSKSFYCLAGHSIDGGTNFSRPFSGIQNTCTYDDITTLAQAAPFLGVLPYVTQNSGPISPAYSMAATCGFVLPEQYVVGVINHSGLTLAASGNTVKHNGVFRTVI